MNNWNIPRTSTAVISFMEIFQKIQEILRNTKLFSTTMVYTCSIEKVKTVILLCNT